MGGSATPLGTDPIPALIYLAGRPAGHVFILVSRRLRRRTITRPLVPDQRVNEPRVLRSQSVNNRHDVSPTVLNPRRSSQAIRHRNAHPLRHHGR